MKKIYLLLTFIFSLSAEAQSVLYSQTQATPGFGAGFSSFLDNTGNVCSLATSFTLSQTSEITGINIFGQQTAENLPTYCSGLILYIYSDNSGVPAGHPILQTGNPLVTVNITNSTQGYSIINTGGFLYTVSVDIAALPGTVILQANTKYWLYFVPKINLDNMSVYSPQNFIWWIAQNGTPNHARISNLTGSAAYPNWTLISGSGATFSIEGLVLGTNEVIYDATDIEVYPNPTSNFVKIKSKEKIKNVSLFDVSGKKIPIQLSDDMIDLSRMPSGSYFLRLETGTNSVVKKIIRK